MGHGGVPLPSTFIDTFTLESHKQGLRGAAVLLECSVLFEQGCGYSRVFFLFWYQKSWLRKTAHMTRDATKLRPNIFAWPGD